MTEITRRSLNTLLAATVFAPFLPQAAGAGSRAEPKRGGSITFATSTEGAKIVPLDNSFQVDIVGKITEGLIALDLQFRPVPQLATAWSVSDDGLVYEFDVRQNVKWHDGKDLTADDVAFSLATLKQHHPRGRQTFANISEIKVLGPHKVRLELSKPAPYLLKALVGNESPIVPKHIFDGKEIGTNPALRRPIGTGPFILKDWVAGSHLLLERNPDYWDSPKPYLDRIIVKFITDPAARSLAFETGEADIGGFTLVPVSDLDRLLESNRNLATSTEGYAYFGYQTQAVLNLRTEPLGKKEVRHALAHAIDISIILNSAWFGRGRLSPTPVSPALGEFHDPSYKHYAFDLARSEALLDQAGYTRGADGFRFPLRITYSPFLDGSRRSAEYIAQALRKVGIDARLNNYDFATFVRTVYTDQAFDISVENIVNAFDPTVGVQRAYWSKNIKKGVPFSNASGYANPEVDRLLEAAASEADSAKRRQLFFDFQKIAYEDLPIINLIAIDQITVYNKKIKNHTITADGVASNFADVYIET